MDKLSKAPVSEVVFGITLLNNRISDSDIISLLNEYKVKYPNIEITPPLANEWLVDYKILPEIDILKSGQILYRLRSSDKKYLIQLQGNKFYLNWIRQDEEDVGNYPGFSKILAVFNELKEVIVSFLKHDIFENNIKYYELSYHDRFEWQEYIENISQIEKIMNFNPPKIGIDTGFNNVFSQYTYQNDMIGGYGSLSINTSTSIKNKQLLRFESIIRGVLPDASSNSWFKMGHDIQNKIFLNTFKDLILDTWR